MLLFQFMDSVLIIHSESMEKTRIEMILQNMDHDTPIIMMVIPIVLFVLSFNEKPISSVIILIAMSLSLPVYYVFLHKRWFQNSLPSTAISLWLTEHLPLVKCEFDGEHVD